MDNGAQSVMISGTMLMHKLFVDSLVSLQMVSNAFIFKFIDLICLVLIGALANSNAQFGQGTGNVHLDNVQCNGSESSLLACSYASVDNCVHAQDAGVQCGFGSMGL